MGALCGGGLRVRLVRLDSLKLVRYTDADLKLTEALETDPEVMRELGGPIAASELAAIHRRRLKDPWWLTIVPEASGPAVGTIGIWEKVLDGVTIHETGWMVLPAFQGRGIASTALRLLIERVRGEPQFESMHAFPPVTNAPSNALCRKFSFALIEQRDFSYAGRTLRCNHWRLETPRQL
jgi:RimJ/RimL family protein N-acetyltransferase